MSYLCFKNPDTSPSAGGFWSRYNPPLIGANKCSSSTDGANPPVQVAFSTAEDSITLPTLTSENRATSGKTEVSIFKDGVCQRTFIRPFDM